MWLWRSSRRVENACQQCSACWARVFSAIGSRPSRPNSRRSAWVKAVPLVVNASNSLACPVFFSDIEKSPSAPVLLRDSYTLSGFRGRPTDGIALRPLRWVGGGSQVRDLCLQAFPQLGGSLQIGSSFRPRNSRLGNPSPAGDHNFGLAFAASTDFSRRMVIA